MSFEAWQKGYQEVKNIIHNEIGVTKEDIREVFRQIAKDEIKKIVFEKGSFIKQTIKEVIREEMVNATLDHKYPRIRKNIWNYGDENSFKDYITGVMKEEITDSLREQFEINLNINKKDSK
jgi:hypothetical protein